MVRWLLWICLCSLGIAECMLTPVQSRPTGALLKPRPGPPQKTPIQQHLLFCTLTYAGADMQQRTQALEICVSTRKSSWKIQGSVNTNKHVRVRSILSPSLILHLLQPNDKGGFSKISSSFCWRLTPHAVSCPLCPPAFILHTPPSAHLADSLSLFSPSSL